MGHKYNKPRTSQERDKCDPNGPVAMAALSSPIRDRGSRPGCEPSENSRGSDKLNRQPWWFIFLLHHVSNP